MSKTQKILVRAPNWIGDAVMATPALSALRQAFQGAEIVFLAKPAVAALFAQHPDIDRVMRYEDPGQHSGVAGLWRLASLLRAGRFDLAFLLQNALEAALLAFFAGIPRRIGYATDGRRIFLTAALPKHSAPPHRSDAYLALMGLTGGSASMQDFMSKKNDPYLVVTSAECDAARGFLKSLGAAADRPLIGINPGAAYGTAKRWLPERFAAVADRLADQFQAQILIFGGKSEIPVAEKIQGMMKTQAVILTGKTTLRQMMACIRQCRLFISNDSGPMHVASALRVPQVAVFGPTNSEASFSNGACDILVQNKVDCAPCRYRDCPIDHRCMAGLGVDVVFDAAARQMSAPRKKRGAVFLDRDGTINPDEGYIDAIARFSLFPGAAGAIAKLNAAGIPVILVTNQSGVARSLFDETFVDELHLYLQRLLAREGAYLDGIYYCPHHPDWTICDCRKPAGGMIQKALSDHAIDFSKSYVVGDKVSDILLSEALLPDLKAGAVLVKTGEGEAAHASLAASQKTPNFISKDLPEAVDWILRQTQND